MAIQTQPEHEWPPEVAARLRMAVVLFVVVLLISLIATISYMAGRLLTPVQAAHPVAGLTGVAHASSDVPKPFPAIAPPIPAEKVAGTSTAHEQVKPEMVHPKLNDSAKEGELAAPSGGTFLQVLATTHAMAERKAGEIRKTGLPVTVAPGPSEKIFRVLVGPLTSAGEIADVRATLLASGFDFFIRRY